MFDRMKKATQVDENRLQQHIFGTYVTLRIGMAVITLAFPLSVYLAGRLDGVCLQDSLSDYYWASATPRNLPRILFVGGLFAIAAFLYLYKGFTKAENWALNLASLLGIGVAVFPMEWECKVNCTGFSWHGFCAITMFVFLVYVVWFRARDTLECLPPDQSAGPWTKPFSLAWYKRLYVLAGLVMALSPATAFFLQSILGKRGTYIFFIETSAILAFGFYWLLKSKELKRSAGFLDQVPAEQEVTQKLAQGRQLR
jgi:hypothetical protein